MTVHIDTQPANLAGGFVCGDTKVALMDGHSLSIADIVEHLHRGVRHTIHSIHVDGTVHNARLLGARRMSHDMEVLAVALDDGSVVHCTPTQAFLGADGTWVEARSLQAGDALLTVDPPPRHVASVTKSPNRDVYEFDVELVNNFQLASGIFLHD